MNSQLSARLLIVASICYGITIAFLGYLGSSAVTIVAVAGVILANFFAVYPQAGLSFTVLAYAIVALGGFGSLLGTLLAALLVGVVQSVTAAYLPPAFKDAFVFASYLLIGLFRPQGLFGRF